MPGWPGAAEVHVWCIDLDCADASCGAAERVLSADEVARANRYVVARDRCRFIAGRAALRRLLAAYIGDEPELLRFHYGPNGKPLLAGEAGQSSLSFNIARSHQLALVAISGQFAVGVDIEYYRSVPNSDALVKRFFTANEQAQLAAGDTSDRRALFLTYWTRKEAIIKLTGSGLQRPLNTLDVSWSGAVSPVRVELEPAASLRITVRDMRVIPEYIAAVAAACDAWSLAFQGFAAVV